MPANRAHLKKAFHRVLNLALPFLITGIVQGTAFTQELSEGPPLYTQSTPITEPLTEFHFSKATHPHRKIRGLKWSTPSLQLTRTASDPTDSDWDYLLTIRGKWNPLGRALISSTPFASIEWDKRLPDVFTLKVRPSAQKSRVTLIAVDPLGVSESQTLTLVVPEFELARAVVPPIVAPAAPPVRKIATIPPVREKEKVAPVQSAVELPLPARDKPPLPLSGFSFTGGLSLSGIQHLETITVADSALNDVNYSAIATTGKASVSYRFRNSPWEIATSTFGTLTSFAVSLEKQIRYFGINGRIGYHIPKIYPRLDLGLYTGAYFTTTFAGGASYGFKNMACPQLYPTLRYELSSTETLSGYFKFSPVSGGGASLLANSNHELAMGFGFSDSRLLKKYTLTGTLDLSLMRLSFPLSEIQTRTLSLGISLRL